MTEVHMSNVLVEKAFCKLEPDMDKERIIATLAKALASDRRIKTTDLDTIVAGAMAREAVGSTGIGHGIAIPHCRSDLVKKIYGAYGYCSEGVGFDSLDGEPVHSVFFLVTPQDHKEQHIQLMKNFASQIRKEHFCEFLRQCGDAKALIDLLTEFEGK